MKEALDHFETKPLEHIGICAGEIHSLQALRVGRAAVGRGDSDRRRVGPGDVEGVEVEAKLANVGPGARTDLECSRTGEKNRVSGGVHWCFLCVKRLWPFRGTPKCEDYSYSPSHFLNTYRLAFLCVQLCSIFFKLPGWRSR